MRISSHPILGEIQRQKQISFFHNGKPVMAYEGETIAAALWAAGERVARHSPKSGEPRGLFCAIGYCSDCLMIVDGIPNTRTCITPVREGMKVELQEGLPRIELEVKKT
jgi:sarcosine oxidase subunit alpha